MTTDKSLIYQIIENTFQQIQSSWRSLKEIEWKLIHKEAVIRK